MELELDSWGSATGLGKHSGSPESNLVELMHAHAHTRAHAHAHTRVCAHTHKYTLEVCGAVCTF